LPLAVAVRMYMRPSLTTNHMGVPTASPLRRKVVRRTNRSCSRELKSGMLAVLATQEPTSPCGPIRLPPNSPVRGRPVIPSGLYTPMWKKVTRLYGVIAVPGTHPVTPGTPKAILYRDGCFCCSGGNKSQAAGSKELTDTILRMHAAWAGGQGATHHAHDR
jgi:hypothetical protein